MEHGLYYRDARTRAKAAIVMQPYNADLRRLAATFTALGLRCHAPPNARASTVFIVVTAPQVTVRWLPEQIAFRPLQ